MTVFKRCLYILSYYLCRFFLVHETVIGWAVVGNIFHLSITIFFTVMRYQKIRIDHDHVFARKTFTQNIKRNVFGKCVDDNSPGLSAEDGQFLFIVSNIIRINDEHYLETPPPVRKRDITMSDNRDSDFRRQLATLRNLEKDTERLHPETICLIASQWW